MNKVNESITKNSEGGIILNEKEGLVVKFSGQDTDQATEGFFVE